MRGTASAVAIQRVFTYLEYLHTANSVAGLLPRYAYALLLAKTIFCSTGFSVITVVVKYITPTKNQAVQIVYSCGLYLCFLLICLMMLRIGLYIGSYKVAIMA